MIHFNLIGPGRVGLAIAKALTDTQQYQLRAVYHPDLTRAKKAQDMLKAALAVCTINQLPEANLYIIATQDMHIETIVHELSRASCIAPNSLVIHLSGILSSAVLAPLQKHHISIGSFHPLKAFCEKNKPENKAFLQTDCAIEGDALAIPKLQALGQALNANTFEIEPKYKATYHAAAIMASNYLITLASEASKLFEISGIPARDAHKLCGNLMQTSLNNLKNNHTAKKALTGPLMRGDIDTIQKHLDAIVSPSTKALYQTAGQNTLSLTDLSNTLHTQLKERLSS